MKLKSKKKYLFTIAILSIIAIGLFLSQQSTDINYSLKSEVSDILLADSMDIDGYILDFPYNSCFISATFTIDNQQYKVNQLIRNTDFRTQPISLELNEIQYNKKKYFVTIHLYGNLFEKSLEHLNIVVSYMDPLTLYSKSSEFQYFVIN